jgi:hypothetical protein
MWGSWPALTTFIAISTRLRCLAVIYLVFVPPVGMSLSMFTFTQVGAICREWNLSCTKVDWRPDGYSF